MSGVTSMYRAWNENGAPVDVIVHWQIPGKIVSNAYRPAGTSPPTGK